MAATIRPSRPEIDLNLQPHLLQELTDSFKFFDRNGDGKISKEELGTVVQSLGHKVTDADLDKLMKDVDKNGDGFIDFQEFKDMNTRAMIVECPVDTDVNRNLPQPGSDDSLMSAFNVFDLDKNGFISSEELHSVLVGFGNEKISLDDCRFMIQCVDEDGDHIVSYTEFEALMSGIRSS